MAKAMQLLGMVGIHDMILPVSWTVGLLDAAVHFLSILGFPLSKERKETKGNMDTTRSQRFPPNHWIDE